MSSRVLTTADREGWEAALPATRSVFGSHAFALIGERHDPAARPLLLVAEAGESRAVYPVLERAIDDGGFGAGSSRVDTTTPPFTGPMLAGGDGVGIPEELDGLLAGEEVVAEFAHLHPWEGAPELVGGGEPDREIVWVDARLDPETLWGESYSKACRKNVKRSEREGVSVRAAESEDDVAEFHRIYISTMDRNDALGAYYFEESYFQSIFSGMPGSARFALAEKDGRVIAATLYLHDDHNVYSFLGGADHEHQQVRPTNAVVHHTLDWARGEGKERLILGGGYRQDDGIFRFKASFSPRRATLLLARRIRDRGAYERLVSAWRERGGEGDPDYFPRYRAPIGAA